MATEIPGGTGTYAPDRLVEAFLTAFVGGDADGVGDLVTADCVIHQPRWPLDLEGRAAVVESTRSNEGTFTDLTVRVEESVVSGDRVAAYVTASGRNVGAMTAGERVIAPTGRRFEVPQFGIYRVEDDRIAEAWIMADALGIVDQLGNLPNDPVAMVHIAARQIRWRLGGRPTLE